MNLSLLELKRRKEKFNRIFGKNEKLAHIASSDESSILDKNSMEIDSLYSSSSTATADQHNDNGRKTIKSHRLSKPTLNASTTLVRNEHEYHSERNSGDIQNSIRNVNQKLRDNIIFSNIDRIEDISVSSFHRSRKTREDRSQKEKSKIVRNSERKIDSYHASKLSSHASQTYDGHDKRNKYQYNDGVVSQDKDIGQDMGQYRGGAISQVKDQYKDRDLDRVNNRNMHDENDSWESLDEEGLEIHSDSSSAKRLHLVQQSIEDSSSLHSINYCTRKDIENNQDDNNTLESDNAGLDKTVNFVTKSKSQRNGQQLFVSPPSTRFEEEEYLVDDQYSDYTKSLLSEHESASISSESPTNTNRSLSELNMYNEAKFIDKSMVEAATIKRPQSAMNQRQSTIKVLEWSENHNTQRGNQQRKSNLDIKEKENLDEMYNRLKEREERLKEKEYLLGQYEKELQKMEMRNSIKSESRDEIHVFDENTRAITHDRKFTTGILKVDEVVPTAQTATTAHTIFNKQSASTTQDISMNADDTMRKLSSDELNLNTSDLTKLLHNDSTEILLIKVLVTRIDTLTEQVNSLQRNEHVMKRKMKNLRRKVETLQNKIDRSISEQTPTQNIRKMEGGPKLDLQSKQPENDLKSIPRAVSSKEEKLLPIENQAHYSTLSKSNITEPTNVNHSMKKTHSNQTSQEAIYVEILEDLQNQIHLNTYPVNVTQVTHKSFQSIENEQSIYGLNRSIIARRKLTNASSIISSKKMWEQARAEQEHQYLEQLALQDKTADRISLSSISNASRHSLSPPSVFEKFSNDEHASKMVTNHEASRKSDLKNNTSKSCHITSQSQLIPNIYSQNFVSSATLDRQNQNFIPGKQSITNAVNNSAVQRMIHDIQFDQQYSRNVYSRDKSSLDSYSSREVPFEESISMTFLPLHRECLECEDTLYENDLSYL